MSKYVIGLIIGLVLAVPMTALASDWGNNQEARQSFGAVCTDVIGNDGKTYPSDCYLTVYKYTDRGNVCYLTNKGSISCVKGN